MTAQKKDLQPRPTVVGGRLLENDMCIWFEGRRVGRIMLAYHHVAHIEEWRWHINPPLPIPSWANGSAPSLETAKAQFRAAWDRFYARLTPEEIAHWHKTDDACPWAAKQ